LRADFLYMRGEVPDSQNITLPLRTAKCFYLAR
jgi:hypothetical protein